VTRRRVAPSAEIESTGPIQDVASGADAIPLVEEWSVHAISAVPSKLTDYWIEKNVVPLV